MKLVLALVSLFFSISALAGAYSNNGGATLYCEGMPEPLVIDLFIAKKDLDFEFRVTKGEAFERARETLELVAKFDPALLTSLQNDLEKIKTTFVLTDEEMPNNLNVGDYYHDADRNCSEDFIAVQTPSVLKIARSWWKTASFENRLTLILHELSFLQARRRGLWSANFVYPMVKFLLDARSLNASHSDFEKVIAVSKWDEFYHVGPNYALLPDSVVFDETGRVEVGVLAHDVYECANGFSMWFRKDFSVRFNQFGLDETAYLVEGTVDRLTLSPGSSACTTVFLKEHRSTVSRMTAGRPQVIESGVPYSSFQLQGERLSSCETVSIYQRRLEFLPDGTPRVLNLTKPARLKVGTGRVLFSAGEVLFHTGGGVQQGRLERATTLFCNGAIRKYAAGELATFDAKGECL